jgi:hypothetical protein
VRRGHHDSPVLHRSGAILGVVESLPVAAALLLGPLAATAQELLVGLRLERRCPPGTVVLRKGRRGPLEGSSRRRTPGAAGGEPDHRPDEREEQDPHPSRERRPTGVGRGYSLRTASRTGQGEHAERVAGRRVYRGRPKRSVRISGGSDGVRRDAEGGGVTRSV